MFPHPEAAGEGGPWHWPPPLFCTQRDVLWAGPRHSGTLFLHYCILFLPQHLPPPSQSQVYNKIDQISMEEVDRLARKPNSVVIR